MGGREHEKTIWDYLKHDLGLRVELNPTLLGYSGAVLSADGSCRYLLARIWDPSQDPAVFVMLNPSTADATVDDRTIHRCMDFARRWECGGIVVVNLFAIRATDPKVMLAHPEPVGAHNDNVIRAVASMHAKHWVAAWGVHGTHRGRDVEVAGLLAAEKVQLQHLLLTKHGHPSHPLYLNAELKPKPFTVRADAVGVSAKAGGR